MDPVDDNTHYVWNIFYFNKEDDRVIVPKRTRSLGFTLNFAHPRIYLIIVACLFCIFLLGRSS